MWYDIYIYMYIECVFIHFLRHHHYKCDDLSSQEHIGVFWAKYNTFKGAKRSSENGVQEHLGRTMNAQQTSYFSEDMSRFSWLSFHWSAKLVDLSTKLCTTCAPNMDWHNLFKEVSPKPETEDQTPKENTVTQIRIRTVIIGAASFFLITKFEKSSLAFPCNAVKGKLHLRKILAKLQETGTKGRHQRERNTKQQKNYPHSR